MKKTNIIQQINISLNKSLLSVIIVPEASHVPADDLNINLITLCICYNGKHLDKQACFPSQFSMLFFYISCKI